MSDELRELDEFCAVRIMGWLPHCRNTAFYVLADKADKIIDRVECGISEWRPTLNPEQSLAVLQKCAEKLGFMPPIEKSADGWAFTCGAHQGNYSTLTEAIARFAKALYSK